MEKQKVAVLLGGVSPEHDVSVLTGLEALDALEPNRYDAFPVYIDLEGRWWVGEALRHRKAYLPDAATRRQLTRVIWPVGGARHLGRWSLLEAEPPCWRQAKRFSLDLVLPALHGPWGEDGTVQGALLAEGVPVVGGDVTSLALSMDKHATLQQVAAAGVPVLPSLLVRRGQPIPTAAALHAALGPFPLFVKPNFLGSSVGVAKVNALAELQHALSKVHRLDTAALIQPCVTPLIEYNVAVRRLPTGQVVTSAIERPTPASELLDFAAKYLAHGALDAGGQKLGGGGLTLADRALNPPELAAGKGAKLAATLRTHAEAVYETLGLAGAPRLDFMVNATTGALVFNEVNPIPGSLGFFLWEAAAAEAQTGYTGLLEDLLQEARQLPRQRHRVVDPVLAGGTIFTRRGG